jgi:hypothetical protein
MIVIPEEANFDLEPMGEEECAERELQSPRIYANRPNLSAGTEWTSATNTVFDGTYRHLHRAARKSPPSLGQKKGPGGSCFRHDKRAAQ